MLSWKQVRKTPFKWCMFWCMLIQSVCTAEGRWHGNGKRKRRNGASFSGQSGAGLVGKLLRRGQTTPGEGWQAGDAIKLYQKRKADARRKLKLPELVPGKVVRFTDLSAMAVEHAETHLKSLEHYKTKDSILREPFGERPPPRSRHKRLTSGSPSTARRPQRPTAIGRLCHLLTGLGWRTGR